MPKHKISVIAKGEPDLDLIEAQLAGLDYETDVHISNSVGETIEAVKGGDVIINLGVPMPREVMREIDTAQAIVSWGHGFDRNDDEAATRPGRDAGQLRRLLHRGGVEPRDNAIAGVRQEPCNAGQGREKWPVDGFVGEGAADAAY